MLSLRYCSRTFFEKYFLIQSLFQFEVINSLRIKSNLLSVSCIWVIQNCTEVQFAFMWFCCNCFCRLFKKLRMSNHFINSTNAKTCHVFSHFLSNKSHKVLYVFRFTTETFTKLWILCCHTDRTCIQITYTHHHTAHSYKRSGGKSKFLCSEKSCDHYITSTHKLSICLDSYTVSQSVHDQCLMSFCQSKLPWKSCIVDGTSRSCSCSSVITGDQNCLCTSFRNTCCDCTNTCLRYKLY